MNFIQQLLAAIRAFFSSLLRGASPPAAPPGTEDEPAQPLAPRVLLIVYDPVVDPATGQKLSQRLNWGRVDDLVAGYVADVDACSGGLVKYNEKVYARTRGADNLFARFMRYDQAAPGRAEVGSIHFAPNSERDYDWGNRRMVASRCDDWLHFPDFQDRVRQVNCQEWGNGEIRAHHTWWLKHLPKVAGRTSGISNNWWKYAIDPNHV